MVASLFYYVFLFIARGLLAIDFAATSFVRY